MRKKITIKSIAETIFNNPNENIMVVCNFPQQMQEKVARYPGIKKIMSSMPCDGYSIWTTIYGKKVYIINPDHKFLGYPKSIVMLEKPRDHYCQSVLEAVEKLKI